MSFDAIQTSSRLAEPVICLLGPTASGKTSAALAIAQDYPVEIISMDSALVYREMNIGTAKPSAAERAQVPHHLIDIIDPTQHFSAAQFAQETHRLIREIKSRGRFPLIVGGTLLYYKALTQGLSPLPSADQKIRKQLEEQAVLKGWPALHAELAKIDPPTAARLAPNDAQRIQRALEIFLISGQPLSAWITAQPPRSFPYNSDKNAENQTHFVPIALTPSDRSVLHERIERRFDQMLDEGFIDEVIGLRQRWPLDAQQPAMRCVGYRQAWEYLEGAIDRATLRNKGIFATRQLCKRQLTWLRSLSDSISIDCLSPHMLDWLRQNIRHYWKPL